MDKAQLRREHIARRLALPEPERALLSARICEHLAALIVAESCGRVGLFLPIRGEPDLTGLHQYLGTSQKVSFALPVVDAVGRGMKFHEWRPGITPLVANRFGILEPKTAKEVSLTASDLLIVPSVALDRRGVRLGYGGGYYDVFLATATARAVGVVYGQSLLETLPAAAHDQRLPRAITEHGLITTRSD